MALLIQQAQGTRRRNQRVIEMIAGRGRGDLVNQGQDVTVSQQTEPENIHFSSSTTERAPRRGKNKPHVLSSVQNTNPIKCPLPRCGLTPNVYLCVCVSVCFCVDRQPYGLLAAALERLKL